MGLQGIEVGRFTRPELWLGHSQGKGVLIGCPLCLGDCLAVAVAHFQPQPPHGVDTGNQAGDCACVIGSDAEILHIALAAHLQIDLPVETAEGEIVNDMAEGWNVQLFAAVQLHSEVVARVPTKLRSEFHGEGGVAALMLAHQHTVAVDLGMVGGAFKGHGNPLAAPLRRRGEKADIAAVKLICRLREAIERQFHTAVGQPDGGQGCRGGRTLGQCGVIGRGKIPIPVPSQTGHRNAPFQIVLERLYMRRLMPLRERRRFLRSLSAMVSPAAAATRMAAATR